MAWVKFALPLVAAGMLAAQPCAASLAQGQQNGSAFAGLNLRMPLGTAKAAKPSARLQFTTAYSFQDGRTGATETFKAPGLEFGTGKSGKPVLFLNGQDTAEMRERMQANGSTGSTLLIVGGVLLVLAVVAVAAGGAGMGDTCPEIDGSRDHCINP